MIGINPGPLICSNMDDSLEYYKYKRTKNACIPNFYDKLNKNNLDILVEKEFGK